MYASTASDSQWIAGGSGSRLAAACADESGNLALTLGQASTPAARRSSCKTHKIGSPHPNFIRPSSTVTAVTDSD